MIQFIYTFSAILLIFAAGSAIIYVGCLVHDRWNAVAGACTTIFLFAALIAGMTVLVDEGEQQPCCVCTQSD